MWSRVYVTLPPEKGRDQLLKLHGVKGWLGYYAGMSFEAFYNIWSPDKHRVFIVGIARIDEGEGLDDSHESPSFRQRLEEEGELVPDTPPRPRTPT